MNTRPNPTERNKNAMLLAAPSALIEFKRERKQMHFVRLFALFGFLLALVIALLVMTQSIASAQGPDAHVHFFYVKSHYQTPKSNAPTSSTSNLAYNGGPVMQSTVTYTIFWSPAAHPITSDYEALINRFFTEVGGSSLYNIMTQYYDNASHIQNSSAFGGTWVDTTPYPHAGDVVDPLKDEDIRASVLRGIAANGWTIAPNHLFLVYTAPGMTECFDTKSCTPGTLAVDYCAYHSWFDRNGQTVLFAFVPYVETWGKNCRTFDQSPNNNIAADATISMMSHELFESITDPEISPENVAWYDFDCQDGTLCGEIADKCEYHYGTLAADGSNVTLGSHHYIVQQEWSNANFTGTSYSGCVLSYGTIASHVYVDRAWTAGKVAGLVKTKFHRGDSIYYFGALRNDGSAACNSSGFWYAKGGSKTLVNFIGTVAVQPGTANWYVKSKIPASAPLRKYTLTVTTICNGQISSASSTFKVVASALSPSVTDDTGTPSGILSQ